MKPVQEIINETLRLGAEGEFATALALLDDAVKDAIMDRKSVVILARHAGVIAEQAGDLAAGRRYYEVAVEHDAEPWTYLALGDVCRRLGDDDAARTHYTTGRMMAEDGRDPEVLGLLKERTGGG
jgi:hypothetical protein